MLIDEQELLEMPQAYGINLTQTMLEKLNRYAELLIEWNQKVNLTSILEPREIAIKHFLDSLLLLDAYPISGKTTMIDVGTGAGFPSVPCAVVNDGLRLTLLDSLNKRVVFLKELSKGLKVSAVSVHARAEEAGKDLQYREKYDIATARAVAHMRELSEYCLPFVKVGGVFIALKGYEIEGELDEAEKAILLLGGEIETVKKYILPDDSKRAIVIIKKISQTPAKYPRISAKIKKQPII